MEGMPFQVSFFTDRFIKRHLQLHIINIEPDHLICQLIRAAEYVRALPFAKTLDYMDVFSEGMRQMAVRKPLLSFFFLWESKRLAAYERTLYKDFDHHIIISAQDRERLKLPTREHVTVIPNGVDASFLHFESIRKPTHDIVFIGNLGYVPNKYAVRYLTSQILPLLLLLKKDIRILIAGARPGYLMRKWKGNKNVTVRGWVKDIREAYCDGRIFVAPMFSGLGLQNKILEAMALGLPCITTSMVNNAIHAKAGEEIFVADEAGEMVNYIIRLLADPDEYARLASAGKLFVTRHFNWEEHVRRMEEVIQQEKTFYVK
jgi:glycosyltransferase involved in cell wall biosynthesis